MSDQIDRAIAAIVGRERDAAMRRDLEWRLAMARLAVMEVERRRLVLAELARR